MDQQPPNHNVGVGGHRHGTLSASQPFSAPAANGDRSTDAARRRHSTPVTSAGPSQEFGTPDHASPAISAAETCFPFALTTRLTHPPMVLPKATPPTDQDLLHDTYYLIEQSIDPEGTEIAECFLHASEQPPITPESLAELDMPRIINNPKLRHDVNFDRELHFRPNLDGSKGRQKLISAEGYWKALEGELFLFGLAHQQLRDPQQAPNEAYWQGVLRCTQKRLPNMFRAIRDILQTLVPDCDQKSIRERLDVELVMQEILNGVCDLIDLGNWFAKVLKNHCAPMRDHMVDSMQTEIIQGAAEEKPERLVNGIRQLLNILEAMKLDVANHQIRHMRTLLIEDTINFQRRYNAHRILMNKIDVPRSRLWLDCEMEHLLAESKRSSDALSNKRPTHLEAMTSALLKGLLFNEHPALYPQTFYLDADRLRAFRMELHASIYQSICQEVLVNMAGAYVRKDKLAEAAITLRYSISAISGVTSRFADRLENIAAEIMRIVLTIENNDPLYRGFDSTLLAFAQERLEFDLCPGSPAFEKHAENLFDRLLPKVHTSVEQNVKLTALHLQDRLVPPLPLPTQPFGFGAVCGPVLVTPNADPDQDFVRRFTHIIVLHWQVWADLVYTSAAYDDDDSSSPSDGNDPPSSGDTSPMIPVAQAVYAPGRKWLPIGVTVTEVPSGLPTPIPSPPPDTQQQSSANSEQGEPSSGPSRIGPEQHQPT